MSAADWITCWFLASAATTFLCGFAGRRLRKDR